MKLKPNKIFAEPATVEACQQDRGTAAERAARAEDAVAQQENTRWHAKAAAEAPKGRGSR
ncbi:hypothetical protein G6541_20075 [Streptomyces albidoflavus]|nr:hypothetical protein [Streptomyces albidoflavus]